MPVMDGVTMLTKLKEDPALKAIPVIMLTAESGRDIALKTKAGPRICTARQWNEVRLFRRRAGDAQGEFNRVGNLVLDIGRD